MLDSSFILLFATTLLIFFLFFFILTSRNKKVLHYLFLISMVELIIWSVAVMLEVVFFNEGNQIYLIFESIVYFGICLTPVSFLLICYHYVHADHPFSWKELLLFIIPVITIIMVFTNDLHHLFYVSYSPAPGVPVEIGPYFYVHSFYSYACLLGGIFYLIRFAIKNLGRLSPQAFLVTAGTFIPLVVNICYTLGVPGFTIYSTPTAFSITITLYVFAMTRFNLLKVTPVALQTIVNRISDGYIVIDPDMNIIDYNKTLKDSFSSVIAIQRHNNLYNVIVDTPSLGIDPDKLMDIIRKAAQSQQTISIEHHFELNDSEMYFTIEFTPIVSGKHCIAIIILLKDITQHVKDFNTIQENQAVLLERQRLASLGQLIGGIAHNLKTPIFSVSGGIDQLQYLVKEYDDSIEDKEVTTKDHHEIAEEMHDWLMKMKTHMAYMSDIITTVKDQAAQFNIDTQGSFTVGSLLKRVDILMKHELIKNCCHLKKYIEVDQKTLIRGDINSLVQILDNIIINAIQSYEGREGTIEIRVSKQAEGTLIAISDHGKGISDKVRDLLFKEMITTKGKHGTGLGLYMSYSTIKGMFRGNMWFDTELGKGTTFYISLPPFDTGKE